MSVSAAIQKAHACNINITVEPLMSHLGLECISCIAIYTKSKFSDFINN